MLIKKKVKYQGVFFCTNSTKVLKWLLNKRNSYLQIDHIDKLLRYTNKISQYLRQWTLKPDYKFGIIPLLFTSLHKKIQVT